MADLKKKFIDILFEGDIDEEELQEDPYFAKKEKEDVTISAKDILYRKSNTSAFINLDDSKENKNENEKETYEMSSQISPIFGLLKEEKRKEKFVDPEATDSQTNKPADSHLDIITSPIYGYANKEEAEKNNYDVKDFINENEEAELHHLFDEEDKLNYSYDTLQDDSKDDEISLFRLFGENK